MIGIDYDEDAEPRNAGDRLAGSYINFYIANGGVVVPIFDDKYDEPAMELITKVFPDRKVVGVPRREILLCGGRVHCIIDSSSHQANDNLCYPILSSYSSQDVLTILVRTP